MGENNAISSEYLEIFKNAMDFIDKNEENFGNFEKFYNNIIKKSKKLRGSLVSNVPADASTFHPLFIVMYNANRLYQSQTLTQLFYKREQIYLYGFKTLEDAKKLGFMEAEDYNYLCTKKGFLETEMQFTPEEIHGLKKFGTPLFLVYSTINNAFNQYTFNVHRRSMANYFVYDGTIKLFIDYNNLHATGYKKYRRLGNVVFGNDIGEIANVYNLPKDTIIVMETNKPHTPENILSSETHIYRPSAEVIQHLHKCHKCNSYVELDFNGRTYLNDSNEEHYTLCNRCIRELRLIGKLRRCEECGSEFITGIDTYTDSDGLYYCKNCNPNLKVIKGYHNAKNNELYISRYADGEDRNTVRYGFELECECSGSPNSSAKKVKERLEKLTDRERMFYFEHDGSLNNGFEVISDPMTMQFIYNNENIIKEMLDAMEESGCKSHDTSTCGLHIHFTRKYINKEQTLKIIYLLEKYKRQVIVFSRKSRRSIQRYAKFYGLIGDNQLTMLEDYNIFKMAYRHFLDNDDLDRYYAFNVTNDNTYEVRIFKGTLNFESFMSCIELVNNLVFIAKYTKVENMAKLSWEDIINIQPTKYLKKYYEEKVKDTLEEKMKALGSDTDDLEDSENYEEEEDIPYEISYPSTSGIIRPILTARTLTDEEINRYQRQAQINTNNTVWF